MLKSCQKDLLSKVFMEIKVKRIAPYENLRNVLTLNKKSFYFHNLRHLNGGVYAFRRMHSLQLADVFFREP